MTDALKRLSDEGVAIWLDDLSRKRITSGNLAELIDQQHVVGVTTNPSIFQKAISQGDGYDQQLADLAARKVTVEEAIRMITTADVRDAADILRPVFDATRRPGRPGLDRGRPAPGPQHQGHGRRGQAAGLAGGPARTPSSRSRPPRRACPAITETIGRGISVNVTLIFSLERYREVMDAYLAGLEKAKAARPGPLQDPLGGVLLRVPRGHRDRQAARRARHRRGQGRQRQGRPRQRPPGLRGVRGGLLLATAGPPSTRRSANKQRPLWASTGVKDPAYKDTLYVDDLVAPNTVNTMPEATLDATEDHGEITGNTIAGTYDAGARRARRGREARDLATTTSSSCSRTRASRSSRRPGTTCSSRPRRSSSASPLRRAEHLVWFRSEPAP